MKDNPYDIHWSDSKNWKWRLFYVCKDDPRVIVPKKPKWAGRTLNFAHDKAFIVFGLTLAVALAPLALQAYLNEAVWLALFCGIILGITIFYYCCDLRVK